MGRGTDVVVCFVRAVKLFNVCFSFQMLPCLCAAPGVNSSRRHLIGKSPTMKGMHAGVTPQAGFRYHRHDLRLAVSEGI